MKNKRQAFIMIGLLMISFACEQADKTKKTIPGAFSFVRQNAWLHALEYALDGAKTRSDYALEAIKKDVKKQGSSREGLKRIKRVELLKKNSVTLVVNIDKIKRRLMKEAGGGLSLETRGVKTPGNSKTVAVIMQQESAELQTKLVDYVRLLHTEYKDLGGAMLSLGKDWKQPQFYDTWYKDANVIEALLNLTQHQTAVLRYEAEILKKMGAGDF